MNDWIVVDVEIQKCIGQEGLGWNDTDKLGISVAVVYEFKSDRYLVYGDTPQEEERLQRRLMKADRISGFNIWKFDFPCIFRLPGRERVFPLLSKTDDLLRRIWLSLGLDPESFGAKHRGWGLDNVAMSTIGQGKTGNGADAPKWYQAGDWAKLVEYCMDDVRIERDLALFVDKYGYVLNRHVGEGALKLSPWENGEAAAWQKPMDLVFR